MDTSSNLNWPSFPEDRELEKLAGMDLHQGLSTRIMACLPERRPVQNSDLPAPVRGSTWLAASAACAALVFTLLGQSFLLDSAFIVRFSVWLTGMVSGGIMAFWGETLIRWNCRLIARLTGRVAEITMLDRITVRLGAVLVFGLAAVIQFAV